MRNGLIIPVFKREWSAVEAGDNFESPAIVLENGSCTVISREYYFPYLTFSTSKAGGFRIDLAMSVPGGNDIPLDDDNVSLVITRNPIAYNVDFSYCSEDLTIVVKNGILISVNDGIVRTFKLTYKAAIYYVTEGRNRGILLYDYEDRLWLNFKQTSGRKEVQKVLRSLV